MATMKDVARLANVSHGTVSNIINGTKGVSLEKIKRVEQAMKELSYKPNAIARNLKLSSSMQIDIILPQISMGSFAKLYTDLSTIANENGYVANLYMTNEDAQLETKLLNQSQMYNRDGVILMTCQPYHKELFEGFLASGLNIVFLEREVFDLEHNYVSVNIKDIIYHGVMQLLNAGYRDIGIIIGPIEYTFEQHCFAGYTEAHKSYGSKVTEEYCAMTNYDRESAFKEAVHILQGERKPQVIVTTCSLTKEAVLKAIEILGIPEEGRPKIVAISSSSWANAKRENVLDILVPFDRMAEMTFALLYECMHSQEGTDVIKRNILQVHNKYPIDLTAQCTGEKKKRLTKTLRVLLTHDSTHESVRALVSRFENQTGYKIEIESKAYPQMYSAIKSQTDADYYDVLDLDIPWIHELAQTGEILQIDRYLKKEPQVKDAFPSQIFEEFCMYNGKAYGLPITFCEQLLFYRKDYFDDLKTQRMFFKEFKRELQPPKTWEEFNETARFFTRAYNEASPTEYGTTIGSQLYSGAICEYLPRFWGFGGKTFVDGRFCFDSEQAQAALSNYKESYLYAPKNSYNNWWPEQTHDFRTGRAAMMILFGDNIASVTERDKSAIIGKIGYEMVPGKYSVDGGWSMAINSRSKEKSMAYEFIKWVCGDDRAVINTILGGFVPCKKVIESLEVAKMYPWLQKTMEAKEFGQQREMPRREDGSFMSESLFEQILGAAVYDAVTGKMDVKEALQTANERLNKELSLK